MPIFEGIAPVPIFYGRSKTNELGLRLNQHPINLQALVSLKQDAADDFEKFLSLICDADNSIKFALMSKQKKDRLILTFLWILFK